MSYFARLAGSSQLSVGDAGAPAAGPGLLSRSASDAGAEIAEVDAFVEAPQQPRSTATPPAPPAVTAVLEPQPVPARKPMVAPPRPLALAATLIGSDVVDSRHRSVSVADERRDPKSAAPVHATAAAVPPPALRMVSRVIEWVAAGPREPNVAGPEGSGEDVATVATQNAPPLEAPDPTRVDVEVLSGDVLPPTHPAGRRPRAERVWSERRPGPDAEPQPTTLPATLERETEDIVQVSIGTISVRVEAPPPSGPTAPTLGPAPALARSEPTRAAARVPSAARLRRHYLRP